MDLWLNIGLFALATVLIGIFGYRLVKAADEFADRTGMGEALTGAVLLGACTSLPGLMTSSMAAWDNLPQMAVSNAIGGIAAQTVWLAIADMAYKKANLEHAAASLSNLVQAALLIALLALPILAANGPGFMIGWVSPFTLLMPVIYIFGLKVAGRAEKKPMWVPEQTDQTVQDEPDPSNQTQRMRRLVTDLAISGMMVAIAGWLLGRSGIGLIREQGLSETTVGALFTSISSSLPELVTTVLAARRGAQTMAVSNIIGGNAFDTLFVAVSDCFYRKGSIYAEINDQSMFLLAITVFLSAVLTMGLLRREKSGVGNIGFESLTILIGYVAAMAFIVMAG